MYFKRGEQTKMNKTGWRKVPKELSLIVGVVCISFGTIELMNNNLIPFCLGYILGMMNLCISKEESKK